MKFSQLFAPTLKEVPKEAEVASHRLLLRAGYIRKVSAGIYDFLPLGLRTIQRIQGIVREEMNRAGAQEVLLPAVQPAELWEQSGRWSDYGPELLRFKDRKGGDFCLGPTHEEVVTALVRGEVRSYRQLPLNLYQIQTKFRDEMRPRAGLMRGREFIMKDAYSFDVDEESARRSYDAMYTAYERIFTRCGLDFRPVEADTGNIGGSVSHEFQVLADSGEDAIVSCSSCGYTANVEKADVWATTGDPAATTALEEVREVPTPGARTVGEVAAFLKVTAAQIVKTLLFLADAKPVAVLIRGDLDVNETKVRSLLGATELHLANDATVRELTGAPLGFAGPVGLTLPVLADSSVSSVASAVVGANAADMHLCGVNIARDVPAAQWVDVRMASEGDACGRCGGTFRSFRGIEVGHVFLLGTKYSVPMGATYLDEAGDENPIVMGCYGIGVTRILAAAIEQNHDDQGIIWPVSIAPFEVIVVPLQMNDASVVAAGEALYDTLRARGVDVLLDDRDSRAGVKFKDADLLGIPYRVTIGSRGVTSGHFEVKHRRESKAVDVPIDDVADLLVRRIGEEQSTADA